MSQASSSSSIDIFAERKKLFKKSQQIRKRDLAQKHEVPVFDDARSIKDYINGELEKMKTLRLLNLTPQVPTIDFLVEQAFYSDLKALANQLPNTQQTSTTSTSITTSTSTPLIINTSQTPPLSPSYQSVPNSPSFYAGLPSAGPSTPPNLGPSTPSVVNTTPLVFNFSTPTVSNKTPNATAAFTPYGGGESSKALGTKRPREGDHPLIIPNDEETLFEYDAAQYFFDFPNSPPPPSVTRVQSELSEEFSLDQILGEKELVELGLKAYNNDNRYDDESNTKSKRKTDQISTLAKMFKKHNISTDAQNPNVDTMSSLRKMTTIEKRKREYHKKVENDRTNAQKKVQQREKKVQQREDATYKRDKKLGELEIKREKDAGELVKAKTKYYNNALKKK